MTNEAWQATAEMRGHLAARLMPTSVTVLPCRQGGGLLRSGRGRMAVRSSQSRGGFCNVTGALRASQGHWRYGWGGLGAFSPSWDRTGL
ncbi:hypothetical protein NQZ68_019152 [Dissostichus eleginoides]|nr:hypothetical protein NQZ68_019152 [Dissostichus eleginoides]